MRTYFSASAKFQIPFANLLKPAQFSEDYDILFNDVTSRDRLFSLIVAHLSMFEYVLLTNFIGHEGSVSKRNWPCIIGDYESFSLCVVMHTNLKLYLVMT